MMRLSKAEKPLVSLRFILQEAEQLLTPTKKKIEKGSDEALSTSKD